jgi:hypothetical protein
MRGLRDHSDLPAPREWLIATAGPRLRILAAPGTRVLHPASPLDMRGRREDRVLGQHPWPPCGKNARGRNHRFGRCIPAFPARMVLRLIRALPGDQTLLSPSVVRLMEPGNLSASLGAPGPHDFAVRERLTPQPRDEPGTGSSQLRRRRKSAARPARSASIASQTQRP